MITFRANVVSFPYPGKSISTKFTPAAVTYNIPGLNEMINEVITSPLVFSSGDVNVYQNKD